MNYKSSKYITWDTDLHYFFFFGIHLQIKESGSKGRPLLFNYPLISAEFYSHSLDVQTGEPR